MNWHIDALSRGDLESSYKIDGGIGPKKRYLYSWWLSLQNYCVQNTLALDEQNDRALYQKTGKYWQSTLVACGGKCT